MAISSLGGISHGLGWLTEKQIFQGFPTHKEAAKQEIYFSTDKAISSRANPLNVKINDLDKLPHNQTINIELSINGKNVEANGVIK